MSDQPAVIVVGASLVGLATAAFLTARNVEVVVVEKHSRISTHPRLQAASPRTMEILGALGLADRIRAAETPNACYGDIIQAPSLAGPETRRFEGPFPHDTYGVSATGWTLIGQDRLEPILLDYLRERQVSVLFEHELLKLRQDAGGVECVVAERGGRTRPLRSQYLVGADGHASTVRGLLGIESTGPGQLGDQSVIVFDAELDELVNGREFFICFIANETVRGALGRLGPAPNTRWCLAPHLGPGRDIEQYSADECAELVRSAVGDPALDVRIESTTSWPIAAQQAERFRAGRVFLAGDSAHVMPPTGGYGGNMGVADAHNLAWKLQAVLTGAAGESLLDSYQSERAGVASFTIEQALLRFRQRTEGGGPGVERASESTVIFGQCYATGTQGHGDEFAATTFADPRDVSGLLGTRAPHVPIVVDGQQVPVHTLLNTRFVVLHGGDDRTAADFERLLAERGLDGRQYCFATAANRDNVARTTDRYRIGPRGAVLIRPDGYLAGRVDDLDATDGIGAIRAALLDCLRCAPAVAQRRAETRV